MVWSCSSPTLGLEEEMNFVKLSHYGADLTVPEFLVPLWPHDLPPEKWPSFLGAGQGWGDKIVPDHFGKARLNPAGLCHDVEWACSAKNLSVFLGANGRFFLNCVSLILASDMEVWPKIKTMIFVSGLYLTAVSTIGILFFSWFTKERKEDVDPLQNSIVRDRLRRLATARNNHWAKILDTRLPDNEDMLYRDDERTI